MSMISFDALKLARRLREAGMPSEQAEAVAEAEAEALSEFIQSHLATKQDIADLKQEISDCRGELRLEITAVRNELKEDIANCRSELKLEIAAVRNELKQDIAAVRIEMHKMRSELIRWMGAFMVAQVGLIAGLIKLIG